MRRCRLIEAKQTNPFQRTGVAEHKTKLYYQTRKNIASLFMPENEKRFFSHAKCANKGIVKLVKA